MWANFTRQWQSSESKGAAEVRSQLGLDPEKPIALLCTNVVGDSLALGRQVFTAGMADWLEKTVRHFAQRSEFQIVVRVHPGELLGAGHPSVDIVRSTVPEMPPHVVLIPPDSSINTYDLIELAHVGLVYTTTVGMEMAMNGVPVVVGGLTHYRGKGFTNDPETLPEYLRIVDQLLRRPLKQKLPREQVELAWNYAYRFFFEYPFPFPWHLIDFWDDIETRSLRSIFSESIDRYAVTVDALLGKPISWGKRSKWGGTGS
jgi:capsule polysaccharide export protein KpsC/LpsZ